MDARRGLAEELRLAIEMDAQELWLLSGVGSLVKIEDRIQTIRPDPLTAEEVRAIHEECLALAGRLDLRDKSNARYALTLPTAGTFLCEFVQRRKTCNLKLQREPEAMLVEPARKLTLPPLAAKATPRPRLRRGR